MKPETYHQKPQAKKKRPLFHASCFTFHEKGIVVYLALSTLSVVLATALFVAGIFVKEFKISRDVVNSLNAVYVADSIMEQALYNIRVPPLPTATIAGTTVCDSLAVPAALAVAGCFYSVTTNPAVAVDMTVPLCSSANANVGAATDCTQIIAKGAYGNTNRAIEIVFGNL